MPVTLTAPRTTAVEVDTSGERDVTADLQAVIDAATESGSTIDLGGGSFRVNGTLELADKRGLTVRNGTIYATTQGPLGFYNRDGAWIQRDRSTRSHWRLTRCEQVQLQGLHVESTNTATGDVAGRAKYSAVYEAEHGFEFIDCTAVTMEDFTTTGTWGDGVYSGGDFKRATGCRDLTIRRGRIGWNGRQGLAFAWADGVLAEDVDVLNSRRSGCDFEPNTESAWVRNVTIRRGSTNSHLLAFPSKAPGDVSGILIEDHTIVAAGAPFVLSQPRTTRRHGWTLRRVTATFPWGSDRFAFEFRDTDDVTVEDCVVAIRDGRKGHCVLVERGGGRITVTGNDFTPGGRVIAVTDPAPDAVVTVQDNTLKEN